MNSKLPRYEETPKSVATVSHTGYIDEQLLPQQIIEGGGPPQRADLNSLPGTVKYIGYIIVYGIPVLFLGLVMAVILFK